MDWSEIPVFIAVAQEGSLSAAARKLGISQPTAGRSIAHFESQFPEPLLDRHARGMRLTDLGRQVLSQAIAAQKLIADIDLMRDQPMDQSKETVRITAPMVQSHFILPNIFADLRKRHPHITIELVASDAQDNLLFRDADIAVRTFETQQQEIVTTKVAEFEIAIVASNTYLETHGVPQTVNDLFRHDLVGYDKNQAIIHAFSAFGWTMTPTDFAVRCDDQAAYWQLVRAGCGIGFMPWPVVQKCDGVTRIFPGFQIPPLPVYLASHPKILRTAKVRSVWDFLASNIRSIANTPKG
jgi:DNA-binding transcriptional LysR family regulator